MQLGTRWRARTAPPAALPAEYVEAVRAIESELPDELAAPLNWTLTWRERRAHLELDDGTRVEPAPSGGIEILRPED